MDMTLLAQEYQTQPTSYKRSSLLRRSKKVLYRGHFVVVAGDFSLGWSLNSNALKIEEKLSENCVGGTIKGASSTKIVLVSLEWFQQH